MLDSLLNGSEVRVAASVLPWKSSSAQSQSEDFTNKFCQDVMPAVDFISQVSMTGKNKLEVIFFSEFHLAIGLYLEV